MTIGIIIVAFLAFVGLIIGCVFSLGRPVMQSGETFLMMLSAGKTDMAYESAAIQFKQEVSRETFDAFLKEFPIATKVKTVSFNQFSIENDIFASISGTITATDGQVSPIYMDLVKENDGWRVLYIDFRTAEERAASAQQQAMQQQGGQQAPPQGEQPVSGEPQPVTEPAAPGADQPVPAPAEPEPAPAE